jgi:nitrile hydratase
MSYVTHADLGGKDCPGAIVPEPEGVPFHAAWEAQVLALTLAMGATGAWNIDMSRAARETLPDYARLSYYEIWFAALLGLLAERGLVNDDELAAGHGLRPGPALPRTLAVADVAAALARGTPVQRAAATAPRFAPGERVRLCAEAAPHHTRLPGYARGKCGVVERVHGVHVFADAHAQGLGEQPQWLYAVAFDAAELWACDAAAGAASVTIDAWESYLEKAP